MLTANELRVSKTVDIDQILPYTTQEVMVEHATLTINQRAERIRSEGVPCSVYALRKAYALRGIKFKTVREQQVEEKSEKGPLPTGVFSLLKVKNLASPAAHHIKPS